MKTLNLSQILNEYYGFNKVFWTSYSVHFETLYFIMQKDFRSIMSDCYFHFICDINKLNESIEKSQIEQKSVEKFIRLQEYCTISAQRTTGSFHPKILLLASDEQLVFIVTSANATPSGLLSNQDLIGVYHYSNEENSNIDQVRSLYQYLRGIDNWVNEAIEDFKQLERIFPFLEEEKTCDNILTIPNEKGLLDQMMSSIADIERLEEIRIFSPFFDDGFYAINEIKKRFGKPVKVFSPSTRFEIKIKNPKHEEIDFYSTESLHKKNFHAKFYEFLFADKSIIFWGSANCSVSGLLNPSRNYEILIKDEMTQDEMIQCWGDLSKSEKKQIEIVVTKEKDDSDEKPNYPLSILEIRKNNDLFIIPFIGEVSDLDSLKILARNSSSEYTNLSVTDINNSTFYVKYETNIIDICVTDDNGEKLSNSLPINNPDAIARRLRGHEEEGSIRDKKTGQIDINKVFSFFSVDNIKRKKTSFQSKKKSYGFWKAPQYSGHGYSAGVDIDWYKKSLALKIKEKRIEKDDGDEGSKNNGREKPKTHNTGSKGSFDQYVKKTGIIVNNICVLTKNDEISKIDQKKWITGLFYLIDDILKRIQDIGPIDIKSVNDLSSLSKYLTQISVWIAGKFPIENSRIIDLELINCISDIYYVISTFRYISYTHDNFLTNFVKEYDELILDVGRSFLYKNDLRRFPGSDSKSIFRQDVIEDLIFNLPRPFLHRKIQHCVCESTNAYIELFDQKIKFYRRTLGNQYEYLLLLKKVESGFCLENLLGEQKTIVPNPNLQECNSLSLV